MPPVRTMINSAITTTPMIDICSSRLVRLVPVRNAGLDSAAMISSTIRMNRAYWPFSHSTSAFLLWLLWLLLLRWVRLPLWSCVGSFA